MKFQIKPGEAKAKLLDEGSSPFTILLQHGTLSVEYFAPQGVDKQTPHRQDELYIVLSGTAQFVRDNARVDCAAGDILFVPAGMQHRFETFSGDFATWVIFYGPDGGETRDLSP